MRPSDLPRQADSSTTSLGTVTSIVPGAASTQSLAAERGKEQAATLGTTKHPHSRELLPPSLSLSNNALVNNTLVDYMGESNKTGGKLKAYRQSTTVRRSEGSSRVENKFEPKYEPR